ncbi:hypothetical protein CPB84DRAFT_114260 [Gymnopilus junonius]|uniref:Uncharacterized protein n=1 Tax=Gymnopilus junonius TaxID=109634 RepID=A0A9P5NXS5_GYMJU|nr:hypothetical protein CPB84DRAFT_114260 [Gymnopilus junonius]
MEPPPAKSPSKIQLITPSASPPPPGYQYRTSDSVPPSKRSRVASTPRRTMSEASSVPRPQIQDGIGKERQASSIRLLDAWAGLEERYSCPVDEDDIIDIQTGEIIKDNGFLRNFRKVDFGAISVPTEDGITADGSSDVSEEEENEYDVDELDAFAEVAESKTSEQRIVEYLGSVRLPSSQIDSEDLREFMGAERRRRELYGSDIDDEDDTGYFSAEDIHSDGVTESRIEYEEDGVVGEEEEEEGDAVEEIENVEALQNEELHGIAEQRILPGPSSEDELDNWDLGELSAVHPVIKDEPVEDSDSDIELIENSALSNPAVQTNGSKMDPPLGSGQRRFQPLSQTSRKRKLFHQLYTPPQSQSSAHGSDTPASDRFIDLSKDSSPPVPSTSFSKTSRVKSGVAQGECSNSKSKPVNQPVQPERQTSPKKALKILPYVLLTPGKALYKKQEHNDSSPTKDAKGKGKAKETLAILSSSGTLDPEVEHASPQSVSGEKGRAKSHGPPQAAPQKYSKNPTTTSRSKVSKNKKEKTPTIKGKKPVSRKSHEPEVQTIPDAFEIKNPQQSTSNVRDSTPSPRNVSDLGHLSLLNTQHHGKKQRNAASLGFQSRLPRL